MKRRHFMAGALALGTMSLVRPARAVNAKPLSILILGGTRFIGVHMAEAALARGHRITFFNRGRTNPGLLPQIPRLTGDRNGELEALESGEWDAVIDNSGYIPRHVELSAQLLQSRAARYLFISSVSVYPDFSQPRDEDSAVAKLEDETVETVNGETYGPLKALCEARVRSIFQSRATVVRPGLIVGPGDNTDRFTYWPARALRGGEFIAPGSSDDAIQIIDARDLAAFCIHLLETGTSGTFNALSAPQQFRMGQLIDASTRAAAARGASARATWIDAANLAKLEIAPWSDMPVWLPASGDTAAFASTPTGRAHAAGLKIGTLERTVDDTLAWHLTRPETERSSLKAGLGADRERDLLERWRALRDASG
ncbi:MAG: NAD-dependent epimerase/dehydratase family protein [Steroidobacteraceae bacterium]